MAIVFFDFDSTVVTKETLDDAIAHALATRPDRDTLMPEIEAITALGMEGKIPFTESVLQRLKVVSLSKSLLEERGRAMLGEITPGMPELFARLRQDGHRPHIVSGGFLEYIAPVAEALAVAPEDTHTNRFIYDADGHVEKPDGSSLLWTNAGKTPLLHSLRQRYPTETFVIVGDGMNDYKAYESGSADMFVGFGANVVREPVKAKAPRFVYSVYELAETLQEVLQ